jgi:hypothetical protein
MRVASRAQSKIDDYPLGLLEVLHQAGGYAVMSRLVEQGIAADRLK